MAEALRRQAAEWFERGRHSIETAHLILDHHGHLDFRYPPVRFALDQAAVNGDLRDAERLMESIEQAAAR